MKKNECISINREVFYEIQNFLVSALELHYVQKEKRALPYLEKINIILDDVDECNEESFTVKETAQYMGVSTKTILRMISDGRLKAIKENKSYVIRESQIMKFKNEKNLVKTIQSSTLEALGLLKEEN